MNQDNGGIIGKINTPTTSLASGVWSLDSQFDSQSSSIWPLAFPQTTIANACRFNRGSSDSLERTPSGAGNRRTFTYSCWFKLGKIASSTSDFYQLFGGTDASGSSNDGLWIDSSNRLYVFFNSAERRITNRRLRDPGAWYHVVLAIDTTQSTASSRIKLYLNGSEITSFSTNSDPSLNYDSGINNTTTQYIAERINDDFFDGYMTEVIMVDGQQLLPTSFGATNPVSNIWEPIAYTGSYGTNGFRLDFANSSALGNDVSGNDNDFTVNNLTSVDQNTDTCSNNFATLNPIAVRNNSNQYYGTFSEGNLKIVGNSATNNANAYSTIGFKKGKWYMEFKILGTSTHYPNLGIVPYRTSVILVGSGQVGSDTVSFAYKATGQKTNNSDSSYGDSFTTNDIIGVAVDMDNGAIYFSKNGTFQASGDPTSGSSKTNAAFGFTPLDEEYFFAAAVYQSASGVEANFGNPSFSISSGNADANGFGNFEYAPPSGYFALCTKNLAEFGG